MQIDKTIHWPYRIECLMIHCTWTQKRASLGDTLLINYKLDMNKPNCST